MPAIKTKKASKNALPMKYLKLQKTTLHHSPLPEKTMLNVSHAQQDKLYE
jgi:hypothetical protein